MKIAMKVIFAFFGLFACVFSASAQNVFTRTYGGPNEESGNSVLETPDHGYLVVGNTGSYGAGSSDIYLVRTDSAGQMLWFKSYGGEDVDNGTDICAAHGGGYLITGFTKSFGKGGYDFYALKINDLGDTIWTKTYGGVDWDFAYSITPTKDTCYIIAGETYSYGSGLNDGWLVKINQFGDTLWTKTVGGSGEDVMRKVRMMNDTVLVAVGNTNSNLVSNVEIAIWKANINGSEISYTQFGFQPAMEFPYDFQFNQFSEIHVVGSVYPNENLPSESLIYKFNPSGTFMYKVDYDTTDDNSNQINALLRLAEDEYFYAGYSELLSLDDKRALGVRTFYGGFFNWSRLFGLERSDIARGITKTYDNGFLLVGETQSYGPGTQSLFMWKIDSAGVLSNVAQVSVDNAFKEAVQLNIFPNPGSHFVQIQSQYFNQNKVNLQIINQYGIVLINKVLFGEESVEISISDYNSGIYYFRFTDEKGRELSMPVVKR